LRLPAERGVGRDFRVVRVFIWVRIVAGAYDLSTKSVQFNCSAVEPLSIVSAHTLDSDAVADNGTEWPA